MQMQAQRRKNGDTIIQHQGEAGVSLANERRATFSFQSHLLHHAPQR